MTDLHTKVKALVVLRDHLNPKKCLRDFSVKAHVGVAGGDHVFILDGRLYRVDLAVKRVVEV